MARTFAGVLLVLAAFARLASAQAPTIAAPASGTVFRAGPDYASDVLHDPWDFNNFEDISPNPDEYFGWATTPTHAWTINGTGPTFISQGQFRGTGAGDNQLMLLPRADAIALNPGRTGARFPIDAARYRKLAIKVSYSNAPGNPNTGGFGRAVVYWYHSSYAEANFVNRSGGALLPGPVVNGTTIFVVDLATVTPATGLIDAGGTTTAPWMAEPFVKGLRFDPSSLFDVQDIAIDWVRLTASDSQPDAAVMPISLAGCNGPSTVTVTDAAGDSIVVVENGSSSPTFNYGILPPGIYSMHAACSGSAASAPVNFYINSPPLVTVLDPDERGDQATDYEYARSGGANRWDFEQLSDIARLGNVSFTEGACASGGCGIVPSPLGGSMFRGSSVGTEPSQLGDPAVVFLSGTIDPLSSLRNRYLTFSLRVNRPFSSADGSVARVIWGSATYSDRGTDTSSQDMRVFPGFNTYTIDLGALTVDNGGIEDQCGLPICPVTPWHTRSVRFLKLRPHEFGQDSATKHPMPPTSFELDDVSINAPDEVNLNGSGPGSAFAIRWTVADSDSAGATYTTRIYIDHDRDTAVKAEITTTALATSVGSNQYEWTPPASLPPGAYWVYIETTENRAGVTDVRGAYSSGPVVVYSVNATSPQVTVGSPGAGQKVAFPFTIQGCAFDQGNANAINIDDLQVFATAGTGVVGIPAGSTYALGYGSGLGTLEYAPLTPATPVICPGIANVASPFHLAGFRVRDVGLPAGPWTLRVLGRSTISGKLTPIANDIPLTSSTLVLPPADFQLSARANTVTVSFQTPVGGPSISGYVIDLGHDAAFTSVAANIVVANPGTYSGPLSDGTWYIRVVSLSASGSRGEASETKAITLPAGGPSIGTPPGAPVLGGTHTASNPVVLSWAPGPGGAPSSYSVVAGRSPGASDLVVFPLGTATTLSANVPLGLRIYVRVIAQNAGGFATSNEVSVFVAPPSAPGPPTLNPGVVSAGNVTLTWAAGAGTAPTSYTILARLSPGGPLAIAVPVTGSSFSIGAPGGTYYVSVVAANSAGSSAESNQITLVVP